MVSIPDYFAKVRLIESGNNPYAVNKITHASGPYQFMSATARQYGGSGEDAMRRFTADNARVLTKTLGREPTPGELYLAHQQGAGGAGKLLSNPDIRAVDLVGRAAVLNNGGTEDMTAAQFARKWTSRFDGGMGPAPALASTGEMGDQGSIGPTGPAGSTGGRQTPMTGWLDDTLNTLFNDPTQPGGTPIARLFGINPAATPPIGTSVPLPGQPGVPAPSKQTPLQDLMGYFRPHTGLLGNSIIGDALRGGLAGLGSSVGTTGLGGLGAGFQGAQQAQDQRYLGQMRTAGLGLEYGQQAADQQKQADLTAKVQNLPAPAGVDQAAWDSFKQTAPADMVLKVYGNAAFRTPAAPPDPTADMQNYKFAKDNGYQGSFEQWEQDEANRKNPQPQEPKTLEERDWQILSGGDVGSSDYAGAYYRQTQPHMQLTPNGPVFVTPQLPAWIKPPNYGQGAPATQSASGGTSSTEPSPTTAGATPGAPATTPAAPANTPPAGTTTVGGGPGNPGLQVSPVPGQEKIPAATQEQNLLAGFALRTQTADKEIEDLMAGGYRPTVKDIMADSVGLLGNFALSSQGRQFAQAKRNFINAVLRRESGAAISPPEFDSANKQYFPMPGDDDGTLKQKALNRQQVIASLRQGAGKFAPPPITGDASGGQQTQAGHAAPVPPKVGEIQKVGTNSFRFKGGDPADPNSWEQVP